jgi:hypothetical protein
MPLRRTIPALLTRIETGPTLSAICFASASHSPRLATSSPQALCLAAGIADFLRRFRRRRLVDIEQHDARPFAGKAGRDRASDAAACAGDDRGMVLEKGHGVFPRCFL